ncbi:hypothetical protein ACH347_39445 [Saccharopolyspora sp. 5N102]|uniref:hypothetical protein n=1 Tax=Saccharopolyspora sp. 5N102 TaxID=3375155 RepID=UPI00379E87B8
MSTLVRYTPEDRDLDLANLSSRDYTLICSLHGTIARGQRTLICLQASRDEDDAAEMFIRMHNGRYWAAHFTGSGHGSHTIAVESDEHRRQKDYWRRAATDAGYQASTEFHTGGGTILDVAIAGPRRTGVEIQRSYSKASSVKSRTTKSYKSGWLPVWFLDTDTRPPWFHHVPAVNCNRISWGELPPRRAATALGLTKFSPLKCTAGAFNTCPDGYKRPCGRWHPKREPWRGLTVDDVAAMAPAEQIVPMRESSGHVRLIPPESLVLYRELTGLAGDYTPGQHGPPAKTPTRSAECANPVHERQEPKRCACGETIYPLTRLVRVRNDVCERCRIELGLSAPHLPM